MRDTRAVVAVAAGQSGPWPALARFTAADVAHPVGDLGRLLAVHSCPDAELELRQPAVRREDEPADVVARLLDRLDERRPPDPTAPRQPVGFVHHDRVDLAVLDEVHQLEELRP